MCINWFEKGTLNFASLLQTLRGLVRRTREHPDLPQVVTRIRTRAGFAGYFMLTCPDCLRTFRATCASENKTEALTAVCTHCDARVPFLLEGSVSA